MTIVTIPRVKAQPSCFHSLAQIPPLGLVPFIFPIRVPCLILPRLSSLFSVRSQIWIILVRQRHVAGLLDLFLILRHQLRVHLDLRRSKGELGNEFKGLVSDELACQPQKWLLKIVVRLGGDIVVLEVLLAMEGDGLGLDFALLDIDFVAAEDNGDIFANSDEVTCGSC